MLLTMRRSEIRTKYLFMSNRQYTIEGISMQRNGLKYFALAVSMGAAPAWAVNKCTSPDGRVSYQEHPCTVGGEKVDTRPSSSGVGEPGFAHSLNSLKQSSSEYTDAVKKASEARIKQINAIKAECDARNVSKLVIGMAAEDALCVPGWRFPKKFNNTTTETSFRQQVIYGGYDKYDDPPKYLYFENGKLTGIQE